jgi:histidine decarboxylase
MRFYTMKQNNTRFTLNRFAKQKKLEASKMLGYPVSEATNLKEFYNWYLKTQLPNLFLNNAGDPHHNSPFLLHSHKFENDVINFFAPLYGYTRRNTWGLITSSGTDGNNHGIYFGAKKLFNQTGKLPIIYTSQDAHYSIKKIADLQNLELRSIKTDTHGQLLLEEFTKALDSKRPALVVITIGSTFKGAIDDQGEIANILCKKNIKHKYIHIDGALFGGYLPFTKHNNLLNRKQIHFDSIAVSGHKFFGFDEPMGVFLVSKQIISEIHPYNVPYLNQNISSFTCSRSAIAPLKFWWKIKKLGKNGFAQQAQQILSNATYLEKKLKTIGVNVWRNQYSNIIYFPRLTPKIMKKYSLAPDYDVRLGGNLAHIVVMQHVTKKIIDELIQDICEHN